jgi:hypothetical protein
VFQFFRIDTQKNYRVFAVFSLYSHTQLKYIAMRTTILSALFLFAGIGLFSACTKEKISDQTKNVTINETISPGATYTLDLGAYGDASAKANITKEASFASVSLLDIQPGTSKYRYTYTPILTKANGTDVVEITLTQERAGGGYTCGTGGMCGGGGSGSKEEKTIVTVNITIR